MKLVVGSDHGGFEYKEAIKKHLQDLGHDVLDVGTYDKKSVNYPVYAMRAGKLVASGEAELGFLVCTSGEGVSIAANKVKGVRCGIGYSDKVTEMSRAHNDCNMIAFGQAYMNLDDVLRRVDIFLNSKFEAGGRHEVRVNLINEIEEENK